MKNHNPSGRNLRFASTGQRLLSMMVLAVFALLIWAAPSGRYDHEVNDFARWLRQHYEALTR
jgi:hypothetical protein